MRYTVWASCRISEWFGSMYRKMGYATTRSLLRNDAGGCLGVSAGAMGRVEMTGGRDLEFAPVAHKRT